MANEEDTTTRHYWLYALRLEQGKYYIGRTTTTNAEYRIKQHMQGYYSAQWVKKHKPIEPVEVIDLGQITKTEAEKQENYRTLQYMKKYGYQNVRGGKFNYSGKYIRFGDMFWRYEDFEIMIALLIMLTAIFALLLRG